LSERLRRLMEIRQGGEVIDPDVVRQRRLKQLEEAGKLKPKMRLVREQLPPEEQVAAPPDDEKARRWTVKGSLWIWLSLLGSAIVGYIIFQQLPHFVRAGGPLVILLIAMQIVVVIIIIERLWTMRGAKGRESIVVYVKKLQQMLQNNQFEEALDLSRRQGGSLANVVYSGMDTWMALESRELTDEERMEETRRSLEEANALETPLLERNLVFLSTIASIGTMAGLTGTTIGMIRAFGAMSAQGMPDASQLALGISEALINTVGGLIIAQTAIVAFNYFTTQVDHFNFMMDETVHEILQMLSRKERRFVS